MADEKKLIEVLLLEMPKVPGKPDAHVEVARAMNALIDALGSSPKLLVHVLMSTAIGVLKGVGVSPAGALAVFAEHMQRQGVPGLIDTIKVPEAPPPRPQREMVAHGPMRRRRRWH